MTNQQLYIDGELVDLGEDTKFTLSIKSNLFRDITDIVSNNTYTVKLPKTVRNQRIIGHVDLVQNGGSTYPYAYHTAQYFRNGVQLIKNGRAAVMSVGEEIELSIIWGIYPALQKIVDDDMSLNEIESDAHIQYLTANNPDDYDTAVQRGFFYANYNPYNDETDYQWTESSSVLGNTRITDIPLNNGAIETPDVWEYCDFSVDDTQTDYKCCLIPVNYLSTIYITNATGGDRYRLYAFLNSAGAVLQVADANQSTRVPNVAESISPGYDVSYVLINILVSKSVGVRISVRNSFPTSSDNIYDILYESSRFRDIRPVVTVPWILDRIKDTKGVAFNWQGDALSIVSSLAIPLIEDEPDSESYESTKVIFKLEPMVELGDIPFYISQGSVFFDTTDVLSKTAVAKVDAKLYFNIKAEWRWEVDTKSPVYSAGTKVYYLLTPCQLIMSIKPRVEDTTDTDIDNSTKYTIGEEGAGYIEKSDLQDGIGTVILAGAGEIDLHEGDTISFALVNSYGTPKSLIFMPIDVTAVLKEENGVPRGGMYPIAKNLPDIAVTDFIKFLCAITGTFPLQIDISGSVDFTEFDTIFNLSRAVDWTAKLIAQSDDNKPQEIEFSLDDYAQQNWYRWKEDDKTHGNYDGCLTIDNSTLEATRDVFVFPFAASDGDNVPLKDYDAREKYEITTDLTYHAVISEIKNADADCEPRIMNLYRSANGNASLRFDIRMQDILDSKYKNLAASLQQAKVIKETMSLSDIEIMEFDETRPVYLAQYGAYFAVMEIETDEDGTSEVTMLEIKQAK